MGERFKKDHTSALPKNVLDLNQYRKKSHLSNYSQVLKKALYLAPKESEAIPPTPFIKFDQITCAENLIPSLQGTEIIFLHANLDWADPIETISSLSKWNESPIILVCPHEKKYSALIKKAYLVGIADILYTPIETEELIQIVDIFLNIKVDLSRKN